MLLVRDAALCLPHGIAEDDADEQPSAIDHREPHKLMILEEVPKL